MQLISNLILTKNIYFTHIEKYDFTKNIIDAYEIRVKYVAPKKSARVCFERFVLGISKESRCIKLVNKDDTPAGTRVCRQARILVPCARLSVVFSLRRRVAVEEGGRT